MKYPVTPKKSLGQHFLISEDIAARIAGSINSDELPATDGKWGSLPILEVGPGTGMLTKYLQASGRNLKVVELDNESVKYLADKMPALDVIEQDFLKMDLETVYPGQFALIGNYPYNISSQIFFRLLDYKDKIPVCAGMLQREVAQRICSGPGSKVYGILSVLLQAWYECQYLFTVDEGCFQPKRKVKSGVIRLIRNGRKTLGCDEKLFKIIVKTSFGQRRKTLKNSLSGLIEKNNPLLGEKIMTQRPEQLSVEEFIDLTNQIMSFRSDSI